jgi:hypothetical protein
LLRPFGIRADRDRVGTIYTAAKFSDAWSRDLPQKTATTATTASTAEAVAPVAVVAAPEGRNGAHEEWAFAWASHPDDDGDPPSA